MLRGKKPIPMTRVAVAVLLLTGVSALPVPAVAQEPPIEVVGGSISPTTITTGDVAIATIEISRPAPPSNHGVYVSLKPSGAWDKVPATGLSHVYVPPGETTVSFPVWMATISGAAPRVVDFRARPLGGAETSFAELTILPADPATRAVVAFEGPTGVVAGADVEPVVVLNTPAPESGIAMNVLRNTAYTGGFISTNHVFIPGGEDRAVHPMRAKSTTDPFVVTTTATLGTSSATWETAIVPAHFAVGGGYVGRGQVTRKGVGIGDTPNPAGTTVDLSSDTPGVSVPATVTIPPGSVGAPFDVDVAGGVTANTAVITATWNGQTATGELTIHGPIT